jgi:hypothetical protein
MGSQPECKCPENFVGEKRIPSELEFAERYPDALVNTALITIESIQELEDLGCTLPIITFESTSLIQVDFDLQQMTGAEIQVLETTFAGVYNSLTLENCDSLGRIVTDVRIVIDDAILASPWSPRKERRLGIGKSSRFAATSKSKCPCPKFTGGFGSRRGLDEITNQTLLWGRKLQTLPELGGCYCPVGADGTGTAPTEDEFLIQYQMAIESIQNETGLLDGFGKITSVQEVEDLKCTLPIITLESVVFIEVDFETTNLTLEDIDALETLYANVYNVMTLEDCDNLGRRIVDVNFIINDPLWGDSWPVGRRERRLGLNVPVQVLPRRSLVTLEEGSWRKVPIKLFNLMFGIENYNPHLIWVDVTVLLVQTEQGRRPQKKRFFLNSKLRLNLSSSMRPIFLMASEK